MTKPSTPSSSSSTSSPGVSDQLPIAVSGPGSVGQLDPTSGYAVYRIYDATRTNLDLQPLLATIISTNSENDPPEGFSRGTEYWKVEGTGIQTSDYVGIRVTKEAHAQADTPPFPAAEASFSVVGQAVWLTTANNGAWTGCQIEEDKRRYALYVSYQKENEWKGQTTFLNKQPGPLFANETGSFTFNRSTDGLAADEWYWVKDTRP